MSIESNALAANQDFKVQRGGGHPWAFRAQLADDSFLDWSTVPGVRMDYKLNGRIVLSQTAGDGLAVMEDPTYLAFYPWGIDYTKDLPAKIYQYDLLVPFEENIHRYVMRGNIIVVEYITA